MFNGVRQENRGGRRLISRHSRVAVGSLGFLPLRIFLKLRRSLDAVQSNTTAHASMVAILSESKLEFMKSPTLASFHSSFNG
jgi:hypothetical protein